MHDLDPISGDQRRVARQGPRSGSKKSPQCGLFVVIQGITGLGDNRRYLGNVLLERVFYGVAQSHLRHRTTGAGARESHLYGAVFLDVDELNIASVRLQGGPNLLQHCLNFVSHEFTSLGSSPADFRLGAAWLVPREL